tara:strand:+ start:112 stop:561 length:450 start_codon:yes stop_codon:yes gene_type:complete
MAGGGAEQYQWNYSIYCSASVVGSSAVAGVCGQTLSECLVEDGTVALDKHRFTQSHWLSESSPSLVTTFYKWMLSDSKEDFEKKWTDIQKDYPICKDRFAVYYKYKLNCAMYAVKGRLGLNFEGDADSEQGNAKRHSWFEADILCPAQL